jgi:hypothetical protein
MIGLSTIFGLFRSSRILKRRRVSTGFSDQQAAGQFAEPKVFVDICGFCQLIVDRSL